MSQESESGVRVRSLSGESGVRSQESESGVRVRSQSQESPFAGISL